jgi:GntR family transcriptional repressor for pyruvate dehydrogenase complex
MVQTGLTGQANIIRSEGMPEWCPLSRTVARRIDEMIQGSEFQEGARLPSQRDLSSLFGVSRSSVREALSILEESGKLRTEPSRGSYRASPKPQSPADRAPMAKPADLGAVSATPYPKSDLSRFRYLIEGQSARLASMRIVDAELEQLEANLSSFKAQTRAMDLAASARTDFEFHRLIVQFSGVRLFVDLHEAFREAILEAVPMYGQQKRAWEPVVEHERIFEALRRHDPDEALYYLQSHIVRSAERLGIVNAHEIL